jgi:hypothetical protein
MTTAVHPIRIVFVDGLTPTMQRVEFDLAKLATAYREQSPDLGPTPPLRCIVCGCVDPDGICVECDVAGETMA